MEATVYSINGPVVKIKDVKTFQMLEMVYVGNSELMGEVIKIDDHYTTIQVYESTTSVKVGEPVYKTNNPLSATLGPGILSNIFDGIERPLKEMAKTSGMFVSAGRGIDSLDDKRKWDVTFIVKKGDVLKSGEIFATCPETSLIEHRIMVPVGLSGEVTSIQKNGIYTLNDELLVLTDEHGLKHSLTMVQKWPIRQARPTFERKVISMPLITGQRVIDTFFPIAKGGAAAVPGGFGAGKTMTQH